MGKRLYAVVAALLALSSPAQSERRDVIDGPVAIRGITVGPIENTLHPDKGYGSEACGRAMLQARRMGANWVSLTAFGRIWDLAPSGIAHDFEWPVRDAERGVAKAIRQAHAAGLRVLLVPHLWVETGGWRGEIELPDDAAWQRWTEAYTGFVSRWARVAESSGADMLAVGVELRSWVTTTRAASFFDVIRRVRKIYRGPLTYGANWDDVEQTVILGELDAIGINAFYPLAQKEGASLAELLQGAEDVRARVQKLAGEWGKPVLFTEFGYTTRRDPALRPWEWPEHLQQVVVDQPAQADAYRALLGAMLDEPSFLGFFVWRVYADPDDTSQEAEWGFSPRGKLAELVLRDAFQARFARERRHTGAALFTEPSARIGSY